jgi:hypothetical protein
MKFSVLKKRLSEPYGNRKTLNVKYFFLKEQSPKNQLSCANIVDSKKTLLQKQPTRAN